MTVLAGVISTEGLPYFCFDFKTSNQGMSYIGRLTNPPQTVTLKHKIQIFTSSGGYITKSLVSKPGEILEWFPFPPYPIGFILRPSQLIAYDYPKCMVTPTLVNSAIKKELTCGVFKMDQLSMYPKVGTTVRRYVDYEGYKVDFQFTCRIMESNDLLDSALFEFTDYTKEEIEELIKYFYPQINTPILPGSGYPGSGFPGSGIHSGFSFGSFSGELRRRGRRR